MKRFGTYALLCAGLAAVIATVWLSRRDRFVPLDHLPTRNATVLSVDFSTLRKGGILSLFASKPGLEEPEYRSFVQATGFDYQKDLDSALVSFSPDATYFILRGKFVWQKLENYAKSNGGGCYQELCHLPGSKPERRISFLRLEPNLMALAVATDDLAAARLRERSPDAQVQQAQVQQSKDPVWLSVPATALKQAAATPGGTRLFASAVSGADRVLLTLGPADGGYAARMEASCTTHSDAQSIAAALSKLTANFKDAHSPDELTGLLVAGTFLQTGNKVFGYWPIQKKLLESLAGGM